MEGFAAWLKAEASLHTSKLESDLVLAATGGESGGKPPHSKALRANTTVGMSNSLSRLQGSRPSAQNVLINQKIQNILISSRRPEIGEIVQSILVLGRSPGSWVVCGLWRQPVFRDFL